MTQIKYFEYFKAVKSVARYEPRAPIKIGYIQLSYADLLNHQFEILLENC